MKRTIQEACKYEYKEFQKILQDFILCWKFYDLLDNAGF